MAESVEIKQHRDYQFASTFGPGVPALLSDEPEPIGKGAGPSPVQLLAASVGSCLASSLFFALRKYKQAPEPISVITEPSVGRNEQNRLRIQRMKVKLSLGVPASGIEHLERALAQFEDFCTVTQSVRAAFPVDVEVYDSTGARVK
jgi:uncharacterized OsmC-like protein